MANRPLPWRSSTATWLWGMIAATAVAHSAITAG
jgi:hypothetical protein